MNALSSALSMLRGFAFSNVLSGLRGLGGGASAFAGLGALPTNKQERVLDKALRALRDNPSIQFTARSYGVEGADLLQEAAVKILMLARADPKFTADPEAWVEKRINAAFVKRMIHNAWLSHARSPYTRRVVSGEVRPVDGEGVEGENVLEQAADEERTPANTERRISVNRELPALFKMYTRNFGPHRRAQLADLMRFGQEAMDSAADLISEKGYAPAEARRHAYAEAARRWSLAHKEAAPGYQLRAADGTLAYDYVRFQRDLVNLMGKLRSMAAGRGIFTMNREQGVFLSENRTRGPQAEGELELPSSRIPRDESGARRYKLAPSFADDDKASPFDAWERMTQASRSAAEKDAAKQRKRDAKDAAKAAKADAKAAKLEARAKKIAEKRAAKTAALDDAEAKLAKKRKVLEAAAETLSPDALAKARAVINDMATKLAAKRAALKAQEFKTSGSSAPVEPSFADRLMAIKAIDAEEAAKADAARDAAYAELDAKAARAPLKGVSAFSGLFGRR